MGANRVYKQDEILFREGEQSDGMYLVRSGALKVYLEKDETETQLALVGPGGMIGEMAFFEEKPRSASVKAAKPSEITKISNEDFEKLIKQIPKWFVSLMSSLSERLRVTNERLQVLEAKTAHSLPSHYKFVQIFNTLQLLIYKYGSNDAKEINIPMATAAEELRTIYGYDTDTILAMLKPIINAKVVGCKKDTYDKDILVLKRSQSITDLVAFSDEFRADHPGLSHLPESTIRLLEIALELASESPYEKVTVDLSEIIRAGNAELIDTSSWKEQIKTFKKPKPFLQLVKVDQNSLGLRLEREDLARYVRKVRILSEFHKAGLDQ